MGAVETRNGQLDRALKHIEAAVKEEPSLFALRKLAAIERQQGQLDRALRSLQAIVEAAGRQADVKAEGHALLQIFEIERDRGHDERARAVLRQALSKALDARELLRTQQDEAEAERLLARVLEHYGQGEAAKRATRRAYDASASDQFQLAATVTDASRRALTLGDLEGGRVAVRRAIDAKLPAEDTVYAALWLALLEQKLQVPSDGTAFEAFSSVDDAAGWPLQLRDWGLGRLNDSALVAAADGPIEEAEAKFYSAMKQRAAGDLQGAMAGLRDVAKSAAVDLVEITIARDLLAEHESKLTVELPAGVALP
jgi:tetratricopeptide (TPR) repeat protein